MKTLLTLCFIAAGYVGLATTSVQAEETHHHYHHYHHVYHHTMHHHHHDVNR